MQISEPNLSLIEESDIQKVFTVISITSLLISLDHGIIPAASIQIEQSLYLNNEQLGLLGSLVYGGTVFMGLIASFLFLKFNPLRTMQLSLITIIISLVLFTFQFQNANIYFACRFITGAGQAPLIVYFPVWVDTFGKQDKTLWLTILQSGVPLGVFIGYVISSIISSTMDWRYGFYLQIMVLIPCLIILSNKPLSVIDVRNKLKQEQCEYERMPYHRLLLAIISVKEYTLVTMTLGCLYFTVTGIQFWISNYMICVLKQKQSLVNTIFSIVSITGPTLGCIIGGSVTQYMGGYNHKNALYIATFAGFFGSIASGLVPFTSSFWFSCTLIWILLFFGGAMVPVLTGIVLSVVEPGLKSFASSNTTTYVNLFGYLPAPIIYGYLSQISPNLGIQVIMLCPAFGFVLLAYVTVSNHNSSNFSFQRPSQKDVTEEVLEFHSVPIQSPIQNLYSK